MGNLQPTEFETGETACGSSLRVDADPTASLLSHLKPACMLTHVLPLTATQSWQWHPREASFHYVLEGRCQIEGTDDGPLSAEAGDFVLIFRPVHRILRAEAQPCRVVSGTIQSSGGDLAPLLAGVPPLHRAHAEGPTSLLTQVLPLVTDDLLVERTGGIAVVNLMLSVVVMEVIRERLQALPVESVGWIGALQDDDLAPVLLAMLSEPEYPWTVEKLASVGCMARSTFARRFREVVGQSPMDVLTSIRMRIATDLLQTSLGLKAVSRQSGYGSISAFTSAFRKRYGVTPAQFRTDPTSGMTR
ncbi:AraC family transcriptional regulator [Bremerella sp. JC817]|uniref:AraC family transcriptional regulator n=1 Tax=Bremerella sp. JC817 TaxID=3231756 RepID=UPI0034577803